MSVKQFTDEEQQILLQNPFTKSVSASNLYTTKEFKEAFLKLYLNGDKSPTQIVTELGYDSKILGYHRITGIQHHIMEKYKAGEPFEDGGYQQRIKGRSIPGDQQPVRTTTDQDIVKQLRAEVMYLRQEVAFLKKLMQNNPGRKSEK
ncbi:MAG: HTH domain-containing protein [Bacteroidaceae bacterium]|nr:hypothetical protein [Bacteroidaceae bacterium]MEE1146714.1 HTH domain-containing protein [Bacteroidaceae bacterium]